VSGAGLDSITLTDDLIGSVSSETAHIHNRSSNKIIMVMVKQPF
jgi:hypothetical protein